jgi:hypothetical protein
MGSKVGGTEWIRSRLKGAGCSWNQELGGQGTVVGRSLVSIETTSNEVGIGFPAGSAVSDSEI